METDKLDDGPKRRHSHMFEVPVPQQVGIFGSALDVTSSYVDVRFSVSDNANFSSLRPQITACLSAAAFHLTAGIILGFSAILIPQLEAADSEIKVNKEEISWIASVIALAVPVGAVFTGFIIDRIGRTNTIRLAALPYISGWICIATAQNFTFLIIGRFLTGIASVMGTSPAVVYTTEVARSDLRGTLLCLGPSLASLGLVVVYTMGAFLHWRIISWISIAYCILPLLMMSMWSPESPVWLVSRGKTELALKSLMYLHNKDEKEGMAELQLAEMVKEHNCRQDQPGQRGSALGKLLRGMARPTGYKPFVILTSIFAFQQCAGIYITIFYAVTFFEDMGATINPYISSIGIGIVRLVFGLITSLLLGRIGRRPLYMLSGAGMAVSMFISGYITKEVEAGNAEPSVIPVICVLIYMVMGVIGLLSIPWTMTAELFAIDIRGLAQGLILSLANIIMFFSLKIFPFLTDLVGGVYAVQWLFAGFSLGSVIFIFLFLPETHRKELAEIQDYFNHNTVYVLSKKKEKVTKVREELGEEMVKLNDRV
uniref:Major facilitator superfamily (MFS) profile domain-containing protein n=1 Tax=Cuerna arida TaxID=1464854 RepID=A0A1B6G1J5_9HEMI